MKDADYYTKIYIEKIKEDRKLKALSDDQKIKILLKNFKGDIKILAEEIEAASKRGKRNIEYSIGIFTCCTFDRMIKDEHEILGKYLKTLGFEAYVDNTIPREFVIEWATNEQVAKLSL